MTILIDTREQKPLKFVISYETKISKIVRTTLKVGDYGCQFNDGYIPPVFFERKSINDLFGTLGKGYIRFKKEINRCIEAKVNMIIVIEGSYSDVLKGTKYSTLEGITIIRKLITIWIRHGIAYKFCSNRKEMASHITQICIGLGKERLRKLNKKRL